MLRVTRGGGIFSGCYCRLEDIVGYFNQNHRLPDYVDTSALWWHYKINHQQDLSTIYFKDEPMTIEYKKDIQISQTDWEPQFSDYRKLNFTDLKPFIVKYFSLSDIILDKKLYLENKYQIDYSNLCGVRFRGNDKCSETNRVSYEEMINKAKQVLSENPKIRFLVQTDEKEFLDAFCKEFPDAIYISELPVMNQQSTTCLVYQLPAHILYETTLYFIAVIKILSCAKFLITTSGNGELWIALFRGNADGIYQYLNPKDVIYGVVNKTCDPTKTNFWIEN